MIWMSAFLLGILGSTHCAGMCGPIALAIFGNNSVAPSFIISQIAYNTGRTFSYIFIGAVLALVGKGFVLMGSQQTLSIVIGVAILCVYFYSRFFQSKNPLTTLLAKSSILIRRPLGKFFTSKSIKGRFAFGVINGFLPCGLVYIAAAAAIALGEPLYGALYMLVFSLGTWPMMLAIPLLSKTLNTEVRRTMYKFVPAFVLVLSALLILRGMDLGIGYLSPQIDNSNTQVEVCD